MTDFPTSFDRDDLLKCARGELFGPGNAQLPLPPMLMMDRITDISGDGGAHGKGHIVAEFDITPDLWFFECHFPGNPIMPGCLGLDGLWQLTGFNLGWRGWQGRGYALGVGEVKLTGMVRPDRKMLTYQVDFTKAVQTRRLTMGVADGRVEADGEVIYQVKDMKVRLQRSLIAPGAGQEGERHAPRRHNRAGDRLVHRQQRGGGAALRCKAGKSGIYRQRGNGRARLSQPGRRGDQSRRAEHVDKRTLRFMGPGAAYAHIAMGQAIADAGLEEKDVVNPMTGLIAGSGGPSTSAHVRARTRPC